MIRFNADTVATKLQSVHGHKNALIASCIGHEGERRGGGGEGGGSWRVLVEGGDVDWECWGVCSQLALRIFLLTCVRTYCTHIHVYKRLQP